MAFNFQICADTPTFNIFWTTNPNLHSHWCSHITTDMCTATYMFFLVFPLKFQTGCPGYQCCCATHLKTAPLKMPPKGFKAAQAERLIWDWDDIPYMEQGPKLSIIWILNHRDPKAKHTIPIWISFYAEGISISPSRYATRLNVEFGLEALHGHAPGASATWSLWSWRRPQIQQPGWLPRFENALDNLITHGDNRNTFPHVLSLGNQRNGWFSKSAGRTHEGKYSLRWGAA